MTTLPPKEWPIIASMGTPWNLVSSSLPTSSADDETVLGCGSPWRRRELPWHRWSTRQNFHGLHPVWAALLRTLCIPEHERSRALGYRLLKATVVSERLEGSMGDRDAQHFVVRRIRSTWDKSWTCNLVSVEEKHRKAYL